MKFTVFVVRDATGRVRYVGATRVRPGDAFASQWRDRKLSKSPLSRWLATLARRPPVEVFAAVEAPTAAKAKQATVEGLRASGASLLNRRYDQGFGVNPPVEIML